MYILIIAAFDENQADEIYKEALKHDLSVIVEVHDQKEAEIALKFKEALIGINNRNLKTLDVSLNNTISIFETIKKFQNLSFLKVESKMKKMQNTSTTKLELKIF